ncbi:MAG: phosphotransferase [Acidimicrobiales bacterium]|nr:phosphotransferase [Acidimicrobiales bacterium]
MTAPSPAFDPVPAELDQILDPGWLTIALDDVADDERVIDVEVAGDSKTLAQKVRFVATVEGADGSRRTRTYCVKGHFGDAMETLTTEAHVYRDLLPGLGLRTPRAYYAGIGDEGRAVIVMDDIVADGGTFLNAHQPYSIDICRETLSQLARLHAATWDDPRGDAEWLAPRIDSMRQMFPAEFLQGLLDDGRGVDVAPELLAAERLQAGLAALAARPATCIIHGDTHSGNVYLDADGWPCWLDWQITQRGHWSTDVAYHLSTVLDIDDRRAHEQELVRGYLRELASQGIEPPPWDEAWASYTTGAVWGWLLWTITSVSSREVVLVHMPRIGAALADHDTFGKLGC